MRTKLVDVWVAYDQPPRKERIPVLDSGDRENCGTRSWRDDITGEQGTAYDGADYALERDVFELLRSYTEAITPFVELLKEIGSENPAKEATGLSYNRYIYKKNWIEAAKELSDLAPRYRAIHDALKPHGATIEMHRYTPKTVNVVVKRGDHIYLDSCIHLNEDGSYDAGWSDGYHINNEEAKYTVEEAAGAAIRIWKEQQEQ